MNTALQTAVTWMVDGVAVDTSPGRISTDGDTLSFSPVATSDTGSYTCTLTVTGSQTPVSIQGSLQSAQKRIHVTGIQFIYKVYYKFFTDSISIQIYPILK